MWLGWGGGGSERVSFATKILCENLPYNLLYALHKTET